MKKIKVAFVGASLRARPCAKELAQCYAETHELSALMDIDRGKMRGWNESLGLNLPIYTCFEQMCDEIRPDIVVITTVDAYHAQYIIQALDRKIACVAEKPLCVNIEQCRDIFAARKRNPEIFAATMHNARYGVVARKLKELLDADVIGKVRSVNYSEMLDLRHGLSYFRRWNRYKELSGGLQIHKSSHHFDKLNWLLNSRVITLTASGALIAYGAEAGTAGGTHCHNCSRPCAYKAEFDPVTHDIFFKYAASDSYTPDLCIYSPEIDIEDYLNIGLEFANGVYCSYNLVAHANYEGEIIIIEGEKGRIEASRRFFFIPGEPGTIHAETRKSEQAIKLFRFGTAPEEYVLQDEAGGHGGADTRLYGDLFGGDPSALMATLEDGVQAVVIGAAVNEALKKGVKINVQSLI